MKKRKLNTMLTIFLITAMVFGFGIQWNSLDNSSSMKEGMKQEAAEFQSIETDSILKASKK